MKWEAGGGEDEQGGGEEEEEEVWEASSSDDMSIAAFSRLSEVRKNICKIVQIQKKTTINSCHSDFAFVLKSYKFTWTDFFKFKNRLYPYCFIRILPLLTNVLWYNVVYF